MATSPIPLWAQQQSPYYRGPTAVGVIFRLAIIAVVLISLLGGYDRVSEHANRGKPDTLCQEHRGAPGWAAACGGRYTPPPPAPH